MRKVVAALGRVAYHRVCCRQDAGPTLGNIVELVPAVEHLMRQFDNSDFCVHTFGFGNRLPRERASSSWPHAELINDRMYVSHYVQGHPSNSGQVKCATVEVFFKEEESPVESLDLPTPMFVYSLGQISPEVRIGTGKGLWTGKGVEDYIEEQDHLQKNLPKRLEKKLATDFECNTVVSKDILETGIAKASHSRTAEDGQLGGNDSVKHFLEYATNSRAPDTGEARFLFSKRQLKHTLTSSKLELIDFPNALRSLCKKMKRPYDNDCLKAVPIQYLTPDFEQPGSHSRSRSKFGTRSNRSKVGSHRLSSQDPECASSDTETVNLQSLTLENIRGDIIRSIVGEVMRSTYTQTSEYAYNMKDPTHQLARVVDFVLLKGFLAASGTSYAEVYNRAMQRRLSTRKHWMLAACAEKILLRPPPPAIFGEAPFLHQYYRFTLEGQSKVAYLYTTLADIDTQGIESPTCAVLAAVNRSEHPQAAYSKTIKYITSFVAYFTRDEQGNDKVFRSATGAPHPWRFFNAPDQEMVFMFRDTARRIGLSKVSPPPSFTTEKALLQADVPMTS